MIWRPTVVENSIIGQKADLIPMNEEDISKVQVWACDPLVCQNYHKCLSDEETLLQKLIINPDSNIRVYVIKTKDNVSIGKLTIELLNDNTADIDMLIGEKIYTGKGYGKDALKVAVKHCFEELNMDAVKVVFKEDNMRAEYCCWSCGLREDKYYVPEEEQSSTSRMVIYKKDYNGY